MKFREEVGKESHGPRLLTINQNVIHMSAHFCNKDIKIAAQTVMTKIFNVHTPVGMTAVCHTS